MKKQFVLFVYQIINFLEKKTNKKGREHSEGKVLGVHWLVQSCPVSSIIRPGINSGNEFGGVSE